MGGAHAAADHLVGLGVGVRGPRPLPQALECLRELVVGHREHGAILLHGPSLLGEAAGVVRGRVKLGRGGEELTPELDRSLGMPGSFHRRLPNLQVAVGEVEVCSRHHPHMRSAGAVQLQGPEQMPDGGVVVAALAVQNPEVASRVGLQGEPRMLPSGRGRGRLIPPAVEERLRLAQRVQRLVLAALAKLLHAVPIEALHRYEDVLQRHKLHFRHVCEARQAILCRALLRPFARKSSCSACAVARNSALGTRPR
mmetsp:Transcript_107448/g.272648  ORF Transcript_107448/g.272648 Transcript_107448/m.272648 type:complete len:254 (+) Transcript_107448:319-1080(+)